jgi:hypothetical protein
MNESSIELNIKSKDEECSTKCHLYFLFLNTKTCTSHLLPKESSMCTMTLHCVGAEVGTRVGAEVGTEVGVKVTPSPAIMKDPWEGEHVLSAPPVMPFSSIVQVISESHVPPQAKGE